MLNLTNYLENYLKHCKNHRALDGKTIAAYRTDLIQFIRFSEENTQKPLKETVSVYVSHLNKRYKPRSRKRKIASMKAFFTYLINEDVLEQDPFYKIHLSFKEPVILPRIIPFDVLDRLFSTIYREINRKDLSSSQWKKILRDLAVIELLFATGVRVSELSGLSDTAVNCTEGTVRIYGKGKRERIMYIENGKVLNVLREYQRIYLNEIRESGCFFINRNGNRLSDQSVRHIINKYTKMAGINLHITPHMFRHSFATFLHEADVDIRYIQSFLGHSSIQTTEIYTKVSTHKQKEIFALKHPRNKIDCQQLQL